MQKWKQKQHGSYILNAPELRLIMVAPGISSKRNYIINEKAFNKKLEPDACTQVSYWFMGNN